MHEVLGPVTVVTGKQRRLTIMECPCDMNAMIDLSKVSRSQLSGTHTLELQPDGNG